MAIAFSCPCGKKLKVKEEMAGKRVRCPECQAVAHVPQLEMEGDVLEEVQAPPAAVSARRPAPPPMPPPMPRRNDDFDDEEDAEDRPRGRRRRREPDEDDRSIRRGRRNEDEPVQEEQSSTNSTVGIVGGILMIIGAAVWFVGGIVWLNRIFFYPPILAILGIVAIVKGIIDKASKRSD